MKDIAKQISLFGAFALLLSSVPVQALEEAPADVQKEVAIKQGFFASMTKEAQDERLKNARKELDKAWKPFIKCVIKGGEDCSQKARTVRRILATILAIVGIAGIIKVAGRVAGRLAYTVSDQKLWAAIQDYPGTEITEKPESVTITELESLLGSAGDISVKALRSKAIFFSSAGLQRAADLLHSRGLAPEDVFYKRINDLLTVKELPVLGR